MEALHKIKSCTKLNLDDLPLDMGLRKKFFEYHPNDINKVQRAYLQKGICQPHDYNFSQRKIGNIYR
jgi:hypothetical protein